MRRGQYKASTELYRVVDGEKFIGWRSDVNNYDVRTYKLAGIRCFRRGVELFIHEDDASKAISSGL